MCRLCEITTVVDTALTNRYADGYKEGFKDGYANALAVIRKTLNGMEEKVSSD